MVLISVTNQVFLTGFSCESRNNGPWVWGCASRYRVKADTGHACPVVRPRMMWAPVPNWSHLDCRKKSLNIVGLVLSSTATSSHRRHLLGPCVSSDVGSSSPKRKNPKKAVQAIAQITVLSWWLVMVRWFWISVNSWYVMGRRIRGAFPLDFAARATPACTRFRIGREDWSLGSGSPRDICMFLTADR